MFRDIADTAAPAVMPPALHAGHNDLRQGLLEPQARISPKYLYDALCAATRC